MKSQLAYWVAALCCLTVFTLCPYWGLTWGQAAVLYLLVCGICAGFYCAFKWSECSDCATYRAERDVQVRERQQCEYKLARQVGDIND